MKPSSTAYGISTSGLGRRLDPPVDPWFDAQITAAATSGGHNIYDLTEVWPSNTGFGYITKPGGLTVEDAWEVNDALLGVGTIVRARFRCWDQTLGATYELWSGSSGTFTDSSFWAEITGNAGGAEPATTYSWKKKVLDPGTHLFVDAAGPVTGTNTLKRAPSVATVAPIIPTGHVVRVWPSPTDAGKFECGATGGRLTPGDQVVTDVACVAGELVVTKKTITATDLTIA